MTCQSCIRIDSCTNAYPGNMCNEYQCQGEVAQKPRAIHRAGTNFRARCGIKANSNTIFSTDIFEVTCTNCLHRMFEDVVMFKRLKRAVQTLEAYEKDGAIVKVAEQIKKDVNQEWGKA